MMTLVGYVPINRREQQLMGVAAANVVGILSTERL
jgi:hypothetical protein